MTPDGEGSVGGAAVACAVHRESGRIVAARVVVADAAHRNVPRVGKRGRRDARDDGGADQQCRDNERAVHRHQRPLPNASG